MNQDATEFPNEQIEALGEPTPGSLAARIARAMIALRSLPETGRNKHENYSYTPASDLMREGGRVLAEEGVAVIPNLRRYELLSQEKPYEVIVVIEYIITDGENTIIALWMGGGKNYTSLDKAIKVAMTNCQGQFLGKLLNIGTDEPDPDTSDHDPSSSNGRNGYHSQNAPRIAPPPPAASQNGTHANGRHANGTNGTAPQRPRGRKAEVTPEKKELVEVIDKLALLKWEEKEWKTTQRKYNVGRLASGCDDIYQLTVEELKRFRDGLAKMMGADPATGEKNMSVEEITAAEEKQKQLEESVDDSFENGPEMSTESPSEDEPPIYHPAPGDEPEEDVDKQIKLLRSISRTCGNLRPTQDVEESMRMIASAHSSNFTDPTNDIVELTTDDLESVLNHMRKYPDQWKEWLMGIGDDFSYPIFQADRVTA